MYMYIIYITYWSYYVTPHTHTLHNMKLKRTTDFFFKKMCGNIRKLIYVYIYIYINVCTINTY